MSTFDHDSPNFNPRARLKELLAIHEYDRTDEQWDEIVELEIQLAPGNRIGAPPIHHSPRKHSPMQVKSGYSHNQGQGHPNNPNQPPKHKKPKGPFKLRKKPAGGQQQSQPNKSPTAPTQSEPPKNEGAA